MTTGKLYDIIKEWRDSVTAEGMIATSAEMDNVLKQLEADMLIEQSKKSGTRSIVTAANRIIKNAELRNKPMLEGMFTNQTRDGSTLYCASSLCLLVCLQIRQETARRYIVYVTVM